jgi:flagellar biogenesis protein FliO
MMRAVFFILTISFFAAVQPALCDPQAPAETAIEKTEDETAPKAKVSPLMQQIAKERSASKQEKAARPAAFQPFGTLTSKNTVYFLMLAFGALLLTKRLQQHKGSELEDNGIQVLSRRALGAKTALLIVDAQGERFLLSQTGEDVQLLSPLELSNYPELEDSSSIAREGANLKEVPLSVKGGQSLAV